MSGLIIWLTISYGLLLSIGIALLSEGYTLVGIIFAGVLPALRVAARFRKHSGYRLIGHSSHSLRADGGRVLRTTEPSWFKLCLTTEIVVITAILILFFVPPLFGK